MRRKYNASTSDVDMTPMLDIVFIMLIFFIVASSFIKETAVDLATQTKSLDKTPPEESPLVVNINAVGQVEMGGRIIAMNTLSANVEAWKLDKRKPQVILVADKSVLTERLVAATDQVGRAGIQNITVAPGS